MAAQLCAKISSNLIAMNRFTTMKIFLYVRILSKRSLNMKWVHKQPNIFVLDMDIHYGM